jgi:glycosyltransferase involved in cell wall biosynthesis
MNQKSHNKKLNILIAYQYLSFKGGLEEVILNQSKYLKENGHNVSIVTSKYNKNEASKTKDGVTIHRFPSLNFTYKLFGIPFAIPILSISNYKKINKLFKNADVINIHGHPYFSSFIYLLISKIQKKPVILTQHNTNIKSNSKFINSVYFLIDQTLGKFNLESSQKIIAVSYETKKYIDTLSKNKQKIGVIYNGVDSKRFNVKTNKNILRKKFGLPQDKFICLTIRRLTLKNGIETFLNTAKLCDQNKTLFLVGGTGPDKKRIEEYIKINKITNVKMLGFVEDNDLASYYSLSDIFILPSIQGEGFPMVVLEAFSSGIPVIATKSGGQIEIIKKDKTGYLVDINKPEQISKIVMQLISNENQLEIMSKNCRALASSTFNWNQNIDKLTQTIISVL